MRKEVEFKNIDRFIRLGVAIGAIRKMKGMSQEQLAEKANISRSHLSVIESTSTVRPFSLEVLFDIWLEQNIHTFLLLFIRICSGGQELPGCIAMESIYPLFQDFWGIPIWKPREFMQFHQ